MRPALAPCLLLVGSLSCASPSVSPLPSDSAASTTSLGPSPSPAQSDPGRAGSSAPIGELPAGSVVPKSVVAREGERVPFVLVLHGYGGTGQSFARHFQLSRLAEKRGFIYLAPDGEPDSGGNRFWDAGPACCNFERLSIDHVSALGAVIAQAAAAQQVDPSRIYVLGYSNGGFMAHRLGCDVAGIRGILSVAGAGVGDPSTCAHAPEVVLQVHGDADQAVPFEGGNVLSRKSVAPHPGAVATVQGWASKKGCSLAPRLMGVLDLEPGLPEAETERLSFSCAENVTLLKVRGAGHSLASSSPAIDALMDQLMK